ncbi:hypothetical protein INT43_001100 [Umbelopsis isabellina]|uniref:U6 small nuclear RNA (adenine-(43)-N(6))-methyltransferase n=1 Tax=Mortierella isabellina TaxID=91625 RepID=A0A8H7PKC4_MORIS|nr:hypothetical protein INT43_001100 [Umbelopsis isabellina]
MRRALTKCLFKKDFGLDVDIPENTLCPPIPNRYFDCSTVYCYNNDGYLLSECQLDDGTVRGIDIIKDPNYWKEPNLWHIDIDPNSIESAQNNIEKNSLQSRIKIFHNTNSSCILPLDELENQGYISQDSQITFSMCNPPFFKSIEEIQTGMDAKLDEPSAVCTGTHSEMITDGGEVAFVTRMVQESILWKHKIIWFTTMIGKRDTLAKVRQEMAVNNIDNYTVTEFNQGHTKRWGFAWSFGDKRVADNTDDLTTAKKLRQVQAPKIQFSTQLPADVTKSKTEMQGMLNDLDAAIISLNGNQIAGSMYSNTWSRKARRQKAQNVKIETTKAETEALFDFKLTFDRIDDEKTKVTATWTKGKDRSIFESFWNHIKKRIEQVFGIVHGDKFGQASSGK